jgi:hypothetical protein
MLHRGLVLNRFFGVIYPMENGCDICNLKCQESPCVRFSESKSKGVHKYKLDLMGVEEVRWGKGGTEPAVILVCIEMRLRIMN